MLSSGAGGTDDRNVTAERSDESLVGYRPLVLPSQHHSSPNISVPVSARSGAWWRSSSHKLPSPLISLNLIVKKATIKGCKGLLERAVAVYRDLAPEASFSTNRVLRRHLLLQSWVFEDHQRRYNQIKYLRKSNRSDGTVKMASRRVVLRRRSMMSAAVASWRKRHNIVSMKSTESSAYSRYCSHIRGKSLKCIHHSSSQDELIVFG